MEDGPLTREQHDGDRRYRRRHGAVVRVALPVNGGAGVANQAGLDAATGAWIAKADADDVLVPHRFERRSRRCAQTGADLCGSAMWEFDEDPDRPVRLRTNPLDHDAIARRMRFNNPINHPDRGLPARPRAARSAATRRCGSCRTTTSSPGCSPAAPG